MTHPVYTLDDSASGKNAYYVDCTPQAQKVAYCACLNRQRTIDSKESYPTDWSTCRDAARQNTCEALRLRQDEIVQGVGLYFRPRPNLEGMQVSAPDGYFTSKDVKPTTRAGSKKGILDLVASGAGGTYTAAIEAAAAGEVTKPDHRISGSRLTPPPAFEAPKPQPPATEPAKVATLTINAGESIGDFLARLRASAAQPV